MRLKEGGSSSSTTGREVSPEALDELGERVFNLQRALLLREGWGGREGDNLLNHLFKEPLQFVRFNRECIVPGRDGNPVSRRGERINREAFENLKSEYYELRGWDITTGFQTKEKLKELEMEDIARDLEGSGLLK